MTTVGVSKAVDLDEPRAPVQRSGGGDRVYRVIVLGGGLVLLGGSLFIVGFLADRSISAISSGGARIVTSAQWQPESIPPTYGLLGDLAGSALIALIALIVAVPIGTGTALLINEYAPVRLRRTFTGLVDLIATVPGVVFGFWGLIILSDHTDTTAVWLSHYAKFIPIFRDPDQRFGNSIFVCGLVVGVMILPVVASISRDVMAQAPRDVCEAALALGGTRWGYISDVILPFARNGIIGATLLGFGRAIGETIAVVLVLAPNNALTHDLLGPVGGSVADLIATNFTSSSGATENALTFGGLLLLITTFLVSFAARAILGGRVRIRAIR